MFRWHLKAGSKIEVVSKYNKVRKFILSFIAAFGRYGGKGQGVRTLSAILWWVESEWKKYFNWKKSDWILMERDK